MIKGIIQTAFYFYLIFHFFFNAPIVFLIFFSLWFEVVLMVGFITLFKLVNVKDWEFDEVFKIAGGVSPVLLIQILFATYISVGFHEFPDDGTIWQINFFQPVIRNLVIALIANFIMNFYLFRISDNNTADDFEVSIMIKVISNTVLAYISMAVVTILPNPNKTIIVYSIILLRILMEILINSRYMKILRR